MLVEWMGLGLMGIYCSGDIGVMSLKDEPQEVLQVLHVWLHRILVTVALSLALNPSAVYLSHTDSV